VGGETTCSCQVIGLDTTPSMKHMCCGIREKVLEVLCIVRRRRTDPRASLYPSSHSHRIV
jgi:hypothetical protein